jgi:hypothetical protein
MAHIALHVGLTCEKGRMYVAPISHALLVGHIGSASDTSRTHKGEVRFSFTAAAHNAHFSTIEDFAAQPDETSRPRDIFMRSLSVQQLHVSGGGTAAGCPIVDLGNGLLLVIADAATQIADPGCEAHLRNRRLVSAWPRKHVADLGYFTFRLLVRGVEFHAKRLAGGVL